MRKVITDLVETILADMHYNDESFDAIDVADLAKKVADNEADVKASDLIKAWAYTYNFDGFFDTRHDESEEEVARDFIEYNAFDYLDMLENEDYEKFMHDIMAVVE